MEFTLKARHGETLIAAVLVLVAGYAIWVAARMPAGTVALPGPGFFPVWLAALLGATSVALLLRVFLRPGLDTASVPLGHGHVVLTLLALAGASFLLERLGFVVSMSLFLMVLFGALSELGWVRSAVAAAVTTGLTYLIFEHFLGVSLPRGFW